MGVYINLAAVALWLWLIKRVKLAELMRIELVWIKFTRTKLMLV